MDLSAQAGSSFCRTSLDDRHQPSIGADDACSSNSIDSDSAETHAAFGVIEEATQAPTQLPASLQATNFQPRRAW